MTLLEKNLQFIKEKDDVLLYKCSEDCAKLSKIGYLGCFMQKSYKYEVYIL